MRKYANLTKECTVIGVSNRIEIWDRETWNDFYEESEESFEDIAEDLIDFDFKMEELKCFIISALC